MFSVSEIVLIFAALFNNLKHGNMKQISLFTHIDRTSSPQKSVGIEETLDLIKNPKHKDLILLARSAGKTATTDFENGGRYYIDYDQYNSVFRNDYVVKELNEIFDSTLNDIIFYSEKFVPSEIKSRLDYYGVKYSKIIKIDDFVEYFQNNTNNNAFISFVWGGYDTIKQEKTEQKGRFKITVRNFYTFIKSTKVPVVTWNAQFESKRAIKNIVNLSSYIYMDVDDFAETSEDKVYKILTDNGLSFVKAVWKSFGGTGFGFLVEVDGLTMDNFKWTWMSIAKKFNELGVKVDKATKDMTRINVLSYDENIFIREKCSPLAATDSLPENQIEIKVEPLKDEAKIEILEQVVSGLYYNDDNFNKDEGRLSYRFYQILFSKLNHIGITLEDTMTFLSQNHSVYPDILNNKKYSIYDIEYIGKNQYSAYSHQFGTVTVEKNLHVSDDFIVLGIYKPFKGDIDLKLNDLFEKAVQKESDAKAVVVYLALIAKRAGISANDVIFYVEKKYGYNPDDKFKIKKLYSNPKYPFGLQVKLKSNIAEKRRQSFIEKLTSEGKIVNIVDGVDSEKYLPNIVKKHFGFTKVTDKNATGLCRNYFKECNSYNIPLLDAIKFLVKNSEFHSISRYANHYGVEVYESYAPYAGINVSRPVEEKKKINRIDYLPANKKLSDLGLEIEDNTILWADTGMGKTTWACTQSDDKRIMLVPTVGALKNIESKYGAATYYEGNKNVCADDYLIVCTYSSAPKLFSLIQNWDGGLGNYTLIVDEQHNFAVSSAKDYRNSELNFVMDHIHFFKKRVFMTGTLFPVEHPSIKDLKIHRVKWEEQTTKNAFFVWCEDKYKAVEKNLVKGKKNIIYLQDKRMNKQLGKLVDYLKGKGWDSIYLLNANEKNEPHFKSLVTTEYLEKDAEVVITTSVTVEAINILDTDVETVQFLTFENPRLMEQMVNRMRKKLPSKIFIYKKTKSDKVNDTINESWFNPVSNQVDLVSNAESLLGFLSKPKQKKNDTYDTVSAQKLFANHIFEKSMLFRVKSDESAWDVDYLSIANKVFNDETNYAKNNLEYLKSILSEYGWSFGEDLVDGEKLTKEEKDSFTGKKKAIEEEMKEYSLNVLEKVSKKTLSELKQEVENKTVFDNTQYPDIEWDVRIKVLKLSKYMEHSEACRMVLELIDVHNNSDEKFNKVMREIAVKIARESGVFDNSISLNNKFSQSVVSLYFEQKKKSTNGILFTKQEIVEWFNRRKRFNIVLKDLDGEKYAIEIFSKYFEIIPVLKGTEVQFKLGGINPMNDVSEFTRKFYEWAEISAECELSFTSDELTNILNSFRKDLPFLSKFKLDNKQALKLLEDYVTVKKTSKRENKNVKTCYKIAELEPKLTKGYEVKINQEVKKSETTLSDFNDVFIKQIFEKTSKKFK